VESEEVKNTEENDKVLELHSKKDFEKASTVML
jgi:hypothetical protein